MRCDWPITAAAKTIQYVVRFSVVCLTELAVQRAVMQRHQGSQKYDSLHTCGLNKRNA